MGSLLRKLLDPLSRRLFSRGLRGGLVEGSGIWLAVAAVAALVRFLMRRDEPRVVREELRLGETITVTHKPGPAKPTRRERRRAAKHAVQQV
jgi:hypothetical protein